MPLGMRRSTPEPSAPVSPPVFLLSAPPTISGSSTVMGEVSSNWNAFERKQQEALLLGNFVLDGQRFTNCLLAPGGFTVILPASAWTIMRKTAINAQPAAFIGAISSGCSFACLFLTRCHPLDYWGDRSFRVTMTTSFVPFSPLP